MERGAREERGTGQREAKCVLQASGKPCLISPQRLLLLAPQMRRARAAVSERSLYQRHTGTPCQIQTQQEDTPGLHYLFKTPICMQERGNNNLKLCKCIRKFQRRCIKSVLFSTFVINCPNATFPYIQRARVLPF